MSSSELGESFERPYLLYDPMINSFILGFILSFSLSIKNISNSEDLQKEMQEVLDLSKIGLYEKFLKRLDKDL